MSAGGPPPAGAGVRLARRWYRDHGPRDSGAVALTFDDGPGEHTPALLDVLGAAGARATFNVLGERVAGREDLVRRVQLEGHEVGCHAQAHESLAGRPLAAFRSIGPAAGAIRRAGVPHPVTFRPPYGSVSSGVVLAARLRGMTTVGWDVNPRDWERPGAEAIFQRVADLAREGSVVCLHDARRAGAETVAAVERIVAELDGRGLRLVPVRELLDLRASE